MEAHNIVIVKIWYSMHRLCQLHFTSKPSNEQIKEAVSKYYLEEAVSAEAKKVETELHDKVDAGEARLQFDWPLITP